MKSNHLLRVPLLPPCDLVVVGATTAAVAAALAARAKGRTVLAVSDRSYFGEETFGTLRLWQDWEAAADPLLTALGAARLEGAIQPAAGKRVLDEALLTAGVRFLFQSRPIAILRDGNGALTGLLLSYRSSWMAVRCGAVIDATAAGLVARLAALPAWSRPRTGAAQWNVLAESQPAAARVGGVRLGEPLILPGNERPMTVQGWGLPMAGAEGNPLDQWHRWRADFTDPLIRQTADMPVEVPPEVFGSKRELVRDLSALPESAFHPQPGLWLAGSALPLDEAGVLASFELPNQVALGRLVGALAAKDGPVALKSGGLRLETGGQEGGTAAATGAFLREQAGFIEVPAPAFPRLGICDVAVAGGGTGGAPAGIAAARAGARTVVVEMQHGLGGVGTLGLIASYYYGNRVGFTSEVDRLMGELDPLREKTHRWNPELRMAVWHRLLREAGGAAWLHSFVCAARTEGGRVTGLIVSTPLGGGLLEAGCVVDASGNAEVAAAAGAPCRWIDRRHVAVQGAGLSPRSPGRDYANSDHTFIDDTDPAGVTHAFVNARAKFKGDFDVATLVDSRERRQIVGELELSPLDFLAGRTFPDTLFTACSNFDTHGFTVHPVFMVQSPDKAPLRAHVPLRCMLPKGLEGVIVTGLGMSAHRDALPVIRMQPDVQNQGFAAGRVAAESAQQGRPVRKIDLKAIQAGLVTAGILEAEVPSHGDSFPLPVEAVRQAVAAGPHTFHDAAVILVHLAEIAPALREQLTDPTRAEGAALVLGLSGDPAAGPRLIEVVRLTGWDEGWNYKGMGQFGRSLSRLDTAIVALGRTRMAGADEVLAAKLGTLPANPDFSHCRAVAVAACCLKSPKLAAPLRDLLARPGMSGHAQLDTALVAQRANSEWNENAARNNALREIYLARGLLASGDADGLGRRTLELYARDLRGPFARHARAILDEGEVPEFAEIA